MVIIKVNYSRFTPKINYQKMYNELPTLEPDDFYLTKEGYKVFTEKYHLKRGYCCENSCRHCPYGYDKKTNSRK